jgi:hypothetical protein
MSLLACELGGERYSMTDWGGNPAKAIPLVTRADPTATH